MTTVERIPCEWESNWKTNPIQAYLQTVKAVILRPVRYFGEIRPFQDFFSLAVFIYVNSFVGMCLGMIAQALLFTASDIRNMTSYLFAVCPLIFMPFLVVAFTFVNGGIMHFFFRWVGRSSKSFETTMTVYGLGMVTLLFVSVLALGVLPSFIYSIVINVWGQARAHEIGAGRAALAVFTPAFVCCCLVLGSVFGLIFVTADFGSLMSHLKSFLN